MSDDLIQSLRAELSRLGGVVAELAARRDRHEAELAETRELHRIEDSRRCALIDLLRWETSPPPELPF